MLHGIWKPGAGLLLWTDDAEMPTAIDPTIDALLARRFRVRTAVREAPDTDAVDRAALALAPDAAADALLTLYPGDPRVAPDLRYLVHVATGLDRWARAGRVVPEVRRAEGAWWPRFTLVGGARQRAWATELAAAMPPVLRDVAPARDVVADITRELTDPVVRRLLPDEQARHPFLRALVAGTEFDDASPATSEAFDRWRASLSSGEPTLVLRLLEPDELPDDPAADPYEGTGPDDALWRLEVCLQDEGDAPEPVALRGSDRARLEHAVRRLEDAARAYPRLRDVPTDPQSLDLLLPTPVVTDLVAHGAGVLREQGVVVLLPRAWTVVAPSLRLKVSSPSSPATAESRTVGVDRIVDYEWELALGDVVLTEAELRRLADAKSGLVRLRGEWVQADPATLGRAAHFVAERHGSGDRAIVDLLASLLDDDARHLPIDEIRATGWAAELLDPAAEPAPTPRPPSLRAELRPYQQRGLDWLAFMSRCRLGAVLADDMGLGKTVQLLALLAHEHDVPGDEPPGPTLLVCPMSVVGNWQREAATFVPDLTVHVHHGVDRPTGDEFAAAAGGAHLVVTTYHLLVRDLESLRGVPWRRVVLDEAQHIKNPRTAQARAARSIEARHRVALTGTPVENRLDELRSILDFANRGILGSDAMFRKRFVVPIEREQDSLAAARLRAVTAPFVLRRVKTDPSVIADLPDKVELTVRANLTEEQAALYQAVVDDMLATIRDAQGMSRKGAVLAALTKLKQVCNHPAHFLKDGSAVTRRGRHRSGKLALVEDTLDAVLAEGDKALLFTQFREFGDLVAPYLAQRFGTEVPFLHGGVSKSARDGMVERFQDPSGPSLMLLSLKAGGTGLNLTAANHVVHLDRWWNPAVENQATDRAFRIGQRKDVQVRKLVCVGTVEERIDDMIASKTELAELAVGAGENWVTEMADDQLRDLLRLGDDAVGE
ncbi:DEAD/DEAH box helicase [Rhodococcus rhodnii]|uniref:Helicase n=2 Tax=Rhodococcus rhodnii TaxID=38312 RepID=R7WIB2_9NOCA|nr:DEAD/DEAH box helicase [Rhodococcus rhodnii]EOM74910.1 helicase [Rhodococcus rhodnii LMG 5362]TXG91649.1 DEAD/DEAH box helicase [Rhodococcus rhodnii]